MRTSLVSLLFAACVACGGSTPEPKAPVTEAADSTPPAPESAAEKSLTSTTSADLKSAPVKTSAVSNTSDGSDIIPPFTAGSTSKPDATTTKKKPKGKSKKKTASN